MDIEQANKKVVEAFMEARPVVTTLAKALDVVPGMHENMILHAGPPITWETASGPVKGAMMGALVFEGKAKTPEEAEKILASGKIEFCTLQRSSLQRSNGWHHLSITVGLCCGEPDP